MAQRIQTWPHAPTTEAETSREARRARKIYALSVVTYAALFAIWQVEPVPLEVYAASVGLWAVCLFPLARWFWNGRKTLPMFELIGVAYGLQFAMPVFLQSGLVPTVYGALPVRWDVVFEALLLAVLGVGTLLAGYYVLPRWRLVQHMPRLDLPLRPKRRPIYIGLALSFGLVLLYLQMAGEIQIESTLGALFGLVTNQPPAGVGTAGLLRIWYSATPCCAHGHFLCGSAGSGGIGSHQRPAGECLDTTRVGGTDSLASDGPPSSLAAGSGFRGLCGAECRQR